MENDSQKEPVKDQPGEDEQNSTALNTNAASSELSSAVEEQVAEPKTNSLETVSIEEKKIEYLSDEVQQEKEDNVVALETVEIEPQIAELGESELNRIEKFIEEEKNLKKTLEDFEDAILFFSEKMYECEHQFLIIEREKHSDEKKLTRDEIEVNEFFIIPDQEENNYKDFLIKVERLKKQTKEIEIKLDEHFNQLYSVENDHFINGNEQTASILELVMKFIFDFINNLMRDELEKFKFIENYDGNNPRCRFDREVYFYIRELCQTYRIIIQIYIDQTKTMGKTQELIKTIEESEEKKKNLVICSHELEDYKVELKPLSYDLLFEMDSVVGVYQDKRGQGASGKVVKVANPEMPGEALAIKITESNTDADYDLNLNEILLHSYINSKKARNVIELVETEFRHKEDELEEEKELFTKMEYAECSLGESIKYRMKYNIEYEEKEILIIALSLLEGLQDLHEKCQIAHRDIKPSNILYSEARGCWVYADLGIAQPFDRNGVSRDYDEHTVAGTAFYMCPEQLKEGHFKDFDFTMKNAKQEFSLKRNDRYALALTLLNMMDLETFDNRNFDQEKEERERDDINLRTKHPERYPLSSEIALSLLSSEKEPFPYEQFYEIIREELTSVTSQYLENEKLLIEKIENEKQAKINLIERYWVRHIQATQMIYNSDYKMEALEELKIIYKELIEKKDAIIAQLNGSKIIDYYALVFKIANQFLSKRHKEKEEDFKLKNLKLPEDRSTYLANIERECLQHINDNRSKFNKEEENKVRIFILKQYVYLANDFSREFGKTPDEKERFDEMYNKAEDEFKRLKDENILSDRHVSEREEMVVLYHRFYICAQEELSIKEIIHNFIDYRNASYRLDEPILMLLWQEEAEVLIRIDRMIKEATSEEIPIEAKDLLIDICNKLDDITENQREKILELPSLIGIQNENIGNY